MTLAVVNAIVLIGGLALLGRSRAGNLPQGKLYEAHASREFCLLLGALVLVFISAIIFIGMSMPLFTQLIGKRPPSTRTSMCARRFHWPSPCAHHGGGGLPALRPSGREARQAPARCPARAWPRTRFVAGVRSPGLLVLAAVAILLFGATFVGWHRGMLRSVPWSRMVASPWRSSRWCSRAVPASRSRRSSSLATV